MSPWRDLSKGSGSVFVILFSIYVAILFYAIGLVIFGSAP